MKKKIKCECCGKKSEKDKWKEISFSCDIMGLLDSIKCPKCGHIQDEK